MEIEPGFVRTADGSALYSQGETRIICTASVSDFGAALDGGLGPRLGDGRVRDASGLDRQRKERDYQARAARTGVVSRSSG